MNELNCISRGHCNTCMFYQEKSDIIGRCRKRAPTSAGYPVVEPKDWCGSHIFNGNTQHITVVVSTPIPAEKKIRMKKHKLISAPKVTTQKATPDPKSPVNGNSRKVAIETLDWGTERVFDSVDSAAKELGVTGAALYLWVSGKGKPRESRGIISTRYVD